MHEDRLVGTEDLVGWRDGEGGAGKELGQGPAVKGAEFQNET